VNELSTSLRVQKLIEHCEKEIIMYRKMADGLLAVLPKVPTAEVKAAHMAGQFEGLVEAFEKVLQMLNSDEEESR
jgi:hypothetical protein